MSENTTYAPEVEITPVSAPLTFTPALLAFGNVVVGTSSSASTTVTYTTSVDSTNTDISVDSATPVGPGAADFSVTSNSCSVISLAGTNSSGYEQCSITVQFTPSVVGPESADLAVAWENAGGESGAQDLALSGTSPPRDGSVYAWGYGGDGELGNGTTTDPQTTPVVVSLPAGVAATEVAAGQYTGYAIGSDGNLYAWGYGADGELGNGTTAEAQTTPVVVSLPAGVTATAVAAGQYTGYAIGSDGNLYAWGQGGVGQLGNGTTTEPQTTPVVVSLPAGVTATEVAAGAHTGYAIGSDGNLYAWGQGGVGQLGNGTTTEPQTTPVVVSLPAGVTATEVAAGAHTGYAIGSDGNLYAWGSAARVSWATARPPIPRPPRWWCPCRRG